MNAILEMQGISKNFTGVKALSDVNFTVEAGEIHALVGENGAGKSTLMKVLSGVYPHGSYEGAILYDGEERRFRDINDSEALGIIIIHQELALIPLMSIAENIFIANPPSRFGIIDRGAVYRRTRELLAKVGLDEAPDTLITNIGVGKQQLVEIAKALSKEVRLLILDEPTASLNEKDSQALLDLLVEFRAHGISSILISHKLNEVSRVADRITVLRDGRTVDTMDCHAGVVEEDRIIRKMVDRDLEHRFPKREPHIGETIFAVKDWSVYHPLHADRQMIRERRFPRPPRRDRRHRRADGRGTDRVRHEHIRAILRTEDHRPGRARRPRGGCVDRASRGRCRPRLRHRGPQGTRPAAGRGRAQERDPRQSRWHLQQSRDRRRQGVAGRQRLSRAHAHPLLQRVPGRRQALGRQPAEGGAVQMAVHRPQGADPRRADARHRCRRQIRDLQHHQ